MSELTDKKTTLLKYFRLWEDDLKNGIISQATLDMRLFGGLSGIPESQKMEVVNELELESEG